jgi:tRNA 2-thiouridine synthesizing protein A
MGLFGFGKKEADGPAAPAGEVTLSDGETYTVAKIVDCIGDSCPRPQLMTKKALKEAMSGDVIEVKVDNPSSVEAIPPLMDELDAAHLETVKAERCWEMYVRKD